MADEKPEPGCREATQAVGHGRVELGLGGIVGLFDLVGEVGSDPGAGLGGQRRRIGVVVGAAHGVDHRLLHDPRAPDLIGAAEAFRLEHELPLRDEDPPAVDSRPGEHDDAGEVGATLGEERRDQSPFAVTDDADPRRINARLLLEPVDPRFGVAGEVDARPLRRIPSRAADTAVVVAEDGDPGPRQDIGEDEERLVIHERLVTVLLAGTGDEDHRRPWPGPPRERERAGEFDAVVNIAEGSLTAVIRERGLGGLRPALLRNRRRGRINSHLLEDQWQGHPPLLPGAGQLPVGPELPGKLPFHRRHLHRPGIAGHRTDGTEAPRLLAEAIHAEVLLAVGPLPAPEAERQFLDDRVERPGPNLVGRRRHRLPGDFPEGERQFLAPLRPDTSGDAVGFDCGHVNRAGRLDLEDEFSPAVGKAFEGEAPIPFIEAVEPVNEFPLLTGRFDGEAELPLPRVELAVPLGNIRTFRRRLPNRRGEQAGARQQCRHGHDRLAQLAKAKPTNPRKTSSAFGLRKATNEARHRFRRQGRPLLWHTA